MAKPTYVVDGVIHYCVANMPGAGGQDLDPGADQWPRCPMLFQIANKGWKQACKDNAEIKHGLNVVGRQGDL